MVEAAKSLFLILSALFPIVDPLGGSPIFLAMTREYSPSTRRALSLRIAINSFFLLVGSYFNSAHPVEMTINPPPTWTTGSEIPKKERMCVPMKYDPTSRKKLLIAIRKDRALRVLGEYSLVIARKIGLPPSGSTMGNKALRIRNRLFAASTKMFLQAAREPLARSDDDREIVAPLGENCW